MFCQLSSDVKFWSMAAGVDADDDEDRGRRSTLRMKILSAEPVCSWEPPEGIPLPASSPTLVGTSQVPRYTDPVNKRGRLASRHPGQVPHCGTDHPSYHHLLENLNTLCNISQGSKVSYANVRGPCASSSGPKGGFKSKPDIKVDKIFAGGDEAELQISSYLYLACYWGMDHGRHI
ncbi:hypothetical protein B0T09DRAFT_317995 [Sordaria sp. MPI-SDFR-AT-0083]|nr:hypothetical protein B0T09DRAFT_317995 [Sordaria sp. MPI-SDFR-AT-0083]